MNITLLIGSLSGGGAERVVANLSNFLVSKGHNVTVMTVSDKKTYFIDDRVKHFVLYGESHSKLPHFVINLLRLYRMNCYFRHCKTDIYVTFLPKLSKFVLAQKKIIKAPVVLAERADPRTFCNISKKNKKIFDKYYRKADGYIFQTKEAKKYYEERGINLTRSIIISNAINPEFINKFFEGKRRKSIVCVGRLTEQKNHSFIIKVFSKICNLYEDYTLEIFGEGPLKIELEKLINNLGLTGKVFLRGFSNNISDKVKDASLFILPSKYEGMPNALMEAMALGIPCISTDCPVGGPKSLIKNGVNGFLVPVDDINEMVNKIKFILDNAVEAKRIGLEAKKISENLSANKIYKMWETFFLSFL